MIRRREADPALVHRKLHDASILLPIAGLILLLPPVASIFAIDATVFGLPLSAAYVFGVWALLIVGARSVGRRLRAREAAMAERDGSDGAV